jgi:hypothetical protein
MAEVWSKELIQMKLVDAKLTPDAKYEESIQHLNTCDDEVSQTQNTDFRYDPTTDQKTYFHYKD